MQGINSSKRNLLITWQFILETKEKECSLLSPYGYFATEILRREFLKNNYSKPMLLRDYGRKYQPAKTEQSPNQVVSCEKRPVEEAGTKAKKTESKASQKKNGEQAETLPPIDVIKKHVTAFDKSLIGKEWLLTKDAAEEAGKHEGTLRNRRNLEDRVSFGEGGIIGVDSQGAVYCMFSGTCYYYHLTICNNSKEYKAFYEKCWQNPSKNDAK